MHQKGHMLLLLVVLLVIHRHLALHRQVAVVVERMAGVISEMVEVAALVVVVTVMIQIAIEVRGLEFQEKVIRAVTATQEMAGLLVLAVERQMQVVREVQGQAVERKAVTAQLQV
jgi:hypothetical protein